jgi:hypothetical protein
MPRLSVDIDLAYLLVESRDKSLAAIEAAMKRIAAQVEKMITGAQIARSVIKA